MATDNLRYKVEADTKNFEAGMKRVQRVSSKVNGGIRRQGQAFTQLAYALDDVQYGFRGVQNNLQAIAVSAGLSGPVVLGITALTIAFGVFLTKLDESEYNIFNFNKEIKTMRSELDGLQSQLVDDDSLEVKIAKSWDKILDKQAQYVGALLGLQAAANATGLGSVYSAISNALGFGTDEASKTAGSIVEGNNQKQKDVNAAREKQRLKDLATANNKYYKDYITNIGHQLEIDQIYGASKQELYQKELKFITEIDTTKLTDEQTAALQRRIEVLQAYGFALDEVVVKSEKAKNTTDELNAQLTGILAGGIADFASSIGEAFAGEGDIGKDLLSGIGKLMVAFGTALIAWGLGWEAFQKAPANPAVAVVAGAALVVAGAAISSIAAKASGKGGGVAGTVGDITSGRVPTFEQGGGTGNGFVGKVRGQDIILTSQNAGDSRRAKTGTALTFGG